MDPRRQDGYTRLEGHDTDTIVSRLAEQDKVPWYSKPNLRLLYLLMFPACMGVEMTNGFDSSMLSGLQSVSSWLEYFHYPRSVALGLMVAAYSLGSAAAVPFVPVVVDKMGRRYPIFFGGVVSIIGAVIQGSAFNVAMFVIARFILGFSGVFCIVAATSLIGELSHPNERAVVGCLFTISHDLGAIAAAGLVLATFAMTSNWGWRIPSLLQAVPSLLQVSFIWLLPESPRWLVSKGRGNEARAILVKYHGEGNENSEFVNAEYSQIKRALETEQKASKMNWKEIFSTSGMRKRATIAIFLGVSGSWCGIGLVLYFLSPILDSIGIHENRTKNIINLVRVSWSLLVGVTGAFIAPRYPRRRIFLVSTVSLFVIFTAWTIASAEYSLTHNKNSAHVVLILIFLYIPAYYLGFTIMVYTFLVELFPFHVRAKGLSVYQWCTRISGFITQVMNPIGIDVAGWKWYLVYCVWNALQVVFVYLMFPETSGRTLEELTFLYESDRLVFEHGDAETLRGAGATEAHYGTMEDRPVGIGS